MKTIINEMRKNSGILTEADIKNMLNKPVPFSITKGEWKQGWGYKTRSFSVGKSNFELTFEGVPDHGADEDKDGEDKILYWKLQFEDMKPGNGKYGDGMTDKAKNEEKDYIPKIFSTVASIVKDFISSQGKNYPVIFFDGNERGRSGIYARMAKEVPNMITGYNVLNKRERTVIYPKNNPKKLKNAKEILM